MRLLEFYKKSWRLLITYPALPSWGIAYLLYSLGVGFLVRQTPDDTCLENLTRLMSSFLHILVGAIFIIVIEECLQDREPTFSGVWVSAKKVFKPLIVLDLVLGFTGWILVFCGRISVGVLSEVGPGAPGELASSFDLFLAILYILSSPMFLFFSYGIILHRMDFLNSIRHGLSVFVMNWLPCLILTVISNAPMFAFMAVVFLIERNNAGITSLNSLLMKLTDPLYWFWNLLVSRLVLIYMSISFQTAYHAFINAFHYPTLKQITPES